MEPRKRPCKVARPLYSMWGLEGLRTRTVAGRAVDDRHVRVQKFEAVQVERDMCDEVRHPRSSVLLLLQPLRHYVHVSLPRR